MSHVSPLLSRGRTDHLGVGLSLACAIHCMVVPLLITALPFAGLSFLVEGPTEVLLILASLALAVGSLCWGFRLHRRWQVFCVLGAALTLIVAGRFLVGEPYEVTLVVAGALLLAAAHLLNRHLCLSCVKC